MIRTPVRLRTRSLLLLSIGLFCGGFGCSEPVVEKPSSPSPDLHYHTAFQAHFDAATSRVAVEIDLQQTSGQVKELNFDAPKARYQINDSDGVATVTDARIRWTPPENGGVLRYQFDVNERSAGHPSQSQQSQFAITRLGDIFPRAKARTVKGASNSLSMSLSGPPQWSFETAYGSLNQSIELDAGPRAYNRPLGWLLAGELGTRRETISEVKVSVSAPKDSGVRRMDILAFLRWVLPELQKMVPALPDRLLVIGAPDDMWRGGISAPNSLYIHTDRPMVSENGTSTLLHELVHVAGVHSAAPGADWIVEGLAEYTGILVLQQSGGTSATRLERTLTSLRDWATRENGRLTDPSTGANTATAVLLFDRLNQELKAAGVPFGQLLTSLIEQGEFSERTLEETTTRLLGQPSRVLAERAP